MFEAFLAGVRRKKKEPVVHLNGDAMVAGINYKTAVFYNNAARELVEMAHDPNVPDELKEEWEAKLSRASELCQDIRDEHVGEAQAALDRAKR